jgi:hypothetical protein
MQTSAAPERSGAALSSGPLPRPLPAQTARGEGRKNGIGINKTKRLLSWMITERSLRFMPAYRRSDE